MMGLPRSPLAGTDGLARMDTDGATLGPKALSGPCASVDRFHQPCLHAPLFCIHGGVLLLGDLE